MTGSRGYLVFQVSPYRCFTPLKWKNAITMKKLSCQRTGEGVVVRKLTHDYFPPLTGGKNTYLPPFRGVAFFFPKEKNVNPVFFPHFFPRENNAFCMFFSLGKITSIMFFSSLRKREILCFFPCNPAAGFCPCSRFRTLAAASGSSWKSM